MAFDYINEAFKRLDFLEEKMFDTSLAGINELSNFLDNDDTDEIIRVIDPEATDVEELQDSYVGKVIINCNICHSHIFENKDEIKIEEEGTVNVDMNCPYCGEQEGFTIVGEIAPFSTSSEEIVEKSQETPTEEESVEVVPSEDATESDAVEETSVEETVESDVVEEDFNENKSLKMLRASKENSTDLSEDFKEVSITTDDQHMEMTSDENGKVTVTTEPISEETLNSDEDMIVPVSDETEKEILVNNDIVDEAEPAVQPEAEETSEEDVVETDIDIEEIDEDSMNELGESYFHKVYENVDSFKTTSVAANDKKIIVEGVITFNSGAKKKTGFVFEAQEVNSRGQLRFNGSNKQLTESDNAFSLVATLDNKKLFAESLKYNYKVNESSIRGIVRRK